MSVDTLIETVDPATGRALATYPVMDDAAIEDAVAEVAEAARLWASNTVENRAALLVGVADALEAQRDSLATCASPSAGRSSRATGVSSVSRGCTRS